MLEKLTSVDYEERNVLVGMNRDSFEFVMYMIHACSKEWNISPADVYHKLKNADCIQAYLVPFYDVLHTQSSRYVVEDIQQYLQNRGVAV